MTPLKSRIFTTTWSRVTGYQTCNLISKSSNPNSFTSAIQPDTSIQLWLRGFGARLQGVLLTPRQYIVLVSISLLWLAFHYCFKFQYSTMLRDKPRTSDADDDDINMKCFATKMTNCNVYTLLRKLWSDDERAKTDLSKNQEVTVLAV
jgi:hypothetical protein